MAKRNVPPRPVQEYALYREHESGDVYARAVVTRLSGKGWMMGWTTNRYDIKSAIGKSPFVAWVGYVKAETEQEALANVAQARP